MCVCVCLCAYVHTPSLLKVTAHDTSFSLSHCFCCCCYFFFFFFVVFPCVCGPHCDSIRSFKCYDSGDLCWFSVSLLNFFLTHFSITGCYEGKFLGFFFFPNLKSLICETYKNYNNMIKKKKIDFPDTLPTHANSIETVSE